MFRMILLLALMLPFKGAGYKYHASVLAKMKKEKAAKKAAQATAEKLDPNSSSNFLSQATLSTGEKATYDPLTKTAELPPGTLSHDAQSKLDEVKKTFPGVEKIKGGATPPTKISHIEAGLKGEKLSKAAEKAVGKTGMKLDHKAPEHTLPSGNVVKYDPNTKTIELPSSPKVEDFNAAAKEFPDATHFKTGSGKTYPVEDLTTPEGDPNKLNLPSGMQAIYIPEKQRIVLPDTTGMPVDKMVADYEAAFKKWPDAKEVSEFGLAADPIDQVKKDIAGYKKPDTSQLKTFNPGDSVNVLGTPATVVDGPNDKGLYEVKYAGSPHTSLAHPDNMDPAEGPSYHALPSGAVSTYDPNTKQIHITGFDTNGPDAQKAKDLHAAMDAHPEADSVKINDSSPSLTSDMKYVADNLVADKPANIEGTHLVNAPGGVHLYTQPPSEPGAPIHFTMGKNAENPLYHDANVGANDPAILGKAESVNYKPGDNLQGTYNPMFKEIKLSKKDGPLTQGQVGELQKAFPDKETYISTPSGKLVALHPGGKVAKKQEEIGYLMGAPPKPKAPPKPEPVDVGSPPEGTPVKLAKSIDTPYDPNKPGGHWDTPDQADQWAQDAYQPWINSLSSPQRSAIKDYKGIGYQDINSGLRNGHLNPTDAKKVKQIDTGLAKAPELPAPVTVYRGRLPTPILQAFENGDEAGLVGKTIADPAYMSTSIDRGVGKNFSGSSKFPFHSMGKITLPKGAKVGHLESLTSMGEHEMLLPRDAKVKITKAYTDPAGYKWIEGEYVLPDHAPTPGVSGPGVPTYTSLYKMPIAELRKLASQRGLNPLGYKNKQALAKAVKGSY